jgi:Tfp pilus assembly pilus retraction ATPase PilT
MEKSLAELHAAGLITEEDALSKANHPQEFRALAGRQRGLQRQAGEIEEAP